MAVVLRPRGASFLGHRKFIPNIKVPREMRLSLAAKWDNLFREKKRKKERQQPTPLFWPIEFHSSLTSHSFAIFNVRSGSENLAANAWN